MTEYVDIPRQHLSPHATPSYGRPVDSHPPTSSGSIPRVSRVSYGSTANGPSWISHSQPATQPNSPPYSSSFQSPPPPHSESFDAYPPRPWAAPLSPDTTRPSWFTSPSATYPSGPRPMPTRPPPNTYSRPPTAGRYADMNQQEHEQASGEFSEGEPDREHEYQDSEEDSESEGSEGEGTDFEEDHMTIDPENMTADAHTDPGFNPQDDDHSPSPPQPKRKGRGFVGGFVAGLKWLPNKMTKRGQKEQLTSNQNPVIVENSAGPSPPLAAQWYGNPHTHPQYEVHPPDPVHVQQIPISGSGITSETTSPLSRATPPPVQPTQIQPAHGLQPPQELPNPHESQTISTPPPLDSPVQIDPQPTSDYGRMSSGGGYTADYTSDYTHETGSSGGRAVQVGKVLSGIRRLPWVSTRIAAEYKPSSSTRAQFDKPVGSWYSKQNREQLDLLETPVIRRAPPPDPPKQRRRRERSPSDSDDRPHARPSHRSHRHRDHRHHHHHRHRDPATGSEGGATAIRPSRTPVSATSGGVMPTSPGDSSHGLGSHSYSYSYYYSPTHPPPLPPPQPIYVYPAAIPPPTKHGQEGAGNRPPEMQQAIPVFMMAAPAPYMMPTSPGKGHHRPSHHHHMPRPHVARPPPS